MYSLWHVLACYLQPDEKSNQCEKTWKETHDSSEREESEPAAGSRAEIEQRVGLFDKVELLVELNEFEGSTRAVALLLC